MRERIARGVGPDRVDIAFARYGDPGDPPLLMVMGLGAQLVNWPRGFLDALVERGLQLVVFDNRDTGRSTHHRDAPAADVAAALAGDLSTASYTLSAMAADSVGLLDHLGLDAVHLLGASLGGAIAQTIAIEHPGRVLSLSSLMSTTGDPAVGQIHPATAAAVFGGPPARSRSDVVERAVRVAQVVGSPAYPTDVDAVAARAGRAYDRSHDDDGVARTAVASIASGDRTTRLQTLTVPTLVLHGTADTMADPSGARATAAAVPGAELVLVDGMGHDLAPGVWGLVATHVRAVVDRGEARRTHVSALT
jgi:pimeloyl-ACP methyl ester carboxylesterase